LLVGIGGSMLGPQFINDAYIGPDRATYPGLRPFFLDNTDPAGLARLLGSGSALHGALDQTLVVVASKSGGTPETRNGMLEVKAVFEAAGVDFPSHAVAITGENSQLDKTATQAGWLARFPMYDWVGGRTSVMSAVGLVPAALTGIDIDAFLEAAKHMDDLTIIPQLSTNPAALLAAAWYHLSGLQGTRAMVVLPYADRLGLFAKYLQQLVMESLGKEFDRDGNLVNTGLTVYGNKGSTDQHAYVQQLRDGLNNFFAVFVEVLPEPAENTLEVEKPGITSGDYLGSFLIGTREALFASDRPSITISVGKVETAVPMLIALFERAVGLYAELLNINAYHQPGVEAGKKAASDTLALLVKAKQYLTTQSAPLSAEEVAAGIGEPEAVETLSRVLRRLAAQGTIKLAAGSKRVDLAKYTA
jgi:glucose-6-phosphate isomerase